MAHTSLIQSLSRLSIGPLVSKVCRNALVTVRPESSSSCATHLTRSFHTSLVCQRVLNRRMYPISKVPSKKGRWEEIKPMKEKYEYTVRPLPLPKTGGRGPNGRIWNWRRGGGNKRRYRMIDFFRCSENQHEPYVEQVQSIVYDPNRSANIALVASGEHKRYIIATVNMKPGDLITSSRQLSSAPIRASEGDAYPVGSLAIGTIVNSMEVIPGEGSYVARAAGTQAQIVRKTSSHVIVRMPSKREVAVLPQCMATVGRICNIGHNKIVIGKAGRNRWRGIRPKSGYFRKKTGRFGRKIKPPKRVLVYKEGARKKKPAMKPVPYEYTPSHMRPRLL